MVEKMRKGSKASLETRIKLRESHMGQRHYCWRGKSTLMRRIRRLSEYTYWKENVRVRDNHKCILCSSTGERFLHVDHIVSFRTLYDEFLLAYSQFSPIDDMEVLVRLAMKWNKFWDMSNGRTLCERCHRDR